MVGYGNKMIVRSFTLGHVGESLPSESFDALGEIYREYPKAPGGTTWMANDDEQDEQLVTLA